jgi:hypothetical protein
MILIYFSFFNVKGICTTGRDTRESPHLLLGDTIVAILTSYITLVDNRALIMVLALCGKFLTSLQDIAGKQVVCRITEQVVEPVLRS